MVITLDAVLRTAARAYGEGPDALVEIAPALADALLVDQDPGPADLELVASKLGVVSVREVRDLPYLGALSRMPGGQLTILVAEQDSERHRFTVAHELGHALLYRAGMPQTEFVEGFCDRFACELLTRRPSTEAHSAYRAPEFDFPVALKERIAITLRTGASRWRRLAVVITAKARDAAGQWLAAWVRVESSWGTGAVAESSYGQEVVQEGADLIEHDRDRTTLVESIAQSATEGVTTVCRPPAHTTSHGQ